MRNSKQIKLKNNQGVERHPYFKNFGIEITLTKRVSHFLETYMSVIHTNYLLITGGLNKRLISVPCAAGFKKIKYLNHVYKNPRR